MFVLLHSSLCLYYFLFLSSWPLVVFYSSSSYCIYFSYSFGLFFYTYTTLCIYFCDEGPSTSHHHWYSIQFQSALRGAGEHSTLWIIIVSFCVFVARLLLSRQVLYGRIYFDPFLGSVLLFSGSLLVTFRFWRDSMYLFMYTFNFSCVISSLIAILFV